MRILARYTIREILGQLLGVFSIVLTIFLVRRFGALLQEAAEGSVGLMVTLELLGLRTIMALPSLLPAALYVSVLLGIGRMSMELETTAMSACGVAPTHLHRSVVAFSAVVALGIGVLGFSVRPWAATRYDALRREAAAGLELGSLVPGRFYQIGTGDEYVVFAETRSSTRAGYLKDVFLQQRHDGAVSILHANEAVEYRDEDEGYRFLRLFDGNRYDFHEGSRSYDVTRFDELVIRTQLSPMMAGEAKEEGLNSSALLSSDTLKSRAELQWRLAMPAAAMILALFAIPLGRIDPRRGRSINLFIAILIYVVYRNLLGVAKNWVEDGDLSPLPGVWLVHAMALMAAIPWLWRDARRA